MPLATIGAAIKAHREGDASGHQEWIKTLLIDYYDPMYAYQLEKKQASSGIQGSAEEVMAWRLRRQLERLMSGLVDKALASSGGVKRIASCPQRASFSPATSHQH